MSDRLSLILVVLAAGAMNPDVILGGALEESVFSIVGISESDDEYDVISGIRDDLVSIGIGAGEIAVPGSGNGTGSGNGSGLTGSDGGMTEEEALAAAQMAAILARCPAGIVSFGPEAIAEVCESPESEEAPSVDALGAYVRTFASSYIDAGSINVDPARDVVLVNKPVYFSASARSYRDDVTVLGVPVQLYLTPVLYTWSPGDGQTFSSEDPGGPWPTGSQTHIYQRAGGYEPQVTTHWQVEISLDGAAWITVPGTGVTTAYGNLLTVVEAESVLTVGNG